MPGYRKKHSGVKFMRFIICMVLLGAISLAIGAEFSAKVIAVLDGDTVLVRQKDGLVKIRLAEIDAPEVGHAGMGDMPPNLQKAQAFGEISKRSLSSMVLGKQVNVDSQAVDQYGRMVAHISVSGLDVNAEQVRRGMAWEYSYFANSAASRQSTRGSLHGSRTLIALQEEAKQEARGLWAMSNPTPPWEWRKLHPYVPGNPLHSTGSSILIAGAEVSPDIACGSKKYCSEMSSCEEAKYYFMRCGIKTLDGNSDGVPCEKLCASTENPN